MLAVLDIAVIFYTAALRKVEAWNAGTADCGRAAGCTIIQLAGKGGGCVAGKGRIHNHAIFAVLADPPCEIRNTIRDQYSASGETLPILEGGSEFAQLANTCRIAVGAVVGAVCWRCPHRAAPVHVHVVPRRAHGAHVVGQAGLAVGHLTEYWSAVGLARGHVHGEHVVVVAESADPEVGAGLAVGDGTNI